MYDLSHAANDFVALKLMKLLRIKHGLNLMVHVYHGNATYNQFIRSKLMYFFISLYRSFYNYFTLHITFLKKEKKTLVGTVVFATG